MLVPKLDVVQQIILNHSNKKIKYSEHPNKSSGHGPICISVYTFRPLKSGHLLIGTL